MRLTHQAQNYTFSCSVPVLPKEDMRPPFLEFFAGSGLVSHALAPYFREAWANDICPKKAAVFWANHKGAPFTLCSITEIRGTSLPLSVLSWASFPCQDLSLAGNGKGIHAKRSGLVWEWLRAMDEMPQRPPLLAAENGLPLAPESLRTGKKGQVKGLGKGRVQTILKGHGITRVLAEEALETLLIMRFF